MSDPIRRRVRIYGFVQGVGFRYSCEREAARLGVTGWVRNEYDGSVHAAFEGDADAVEEMVRWCKAGPRHADVERVDVEIEEPQGDRTFRVSG